MSHKKDISSLFDRSGNLTREAMQRYIEGRLDGDELKAVGAHLENDPFAREAVEGLRRHHPADLEQELAGLDARIGAVAGKKAGAPVRSFRRYYYSAAAGLAVLAVMTVMLVFMFRSPVNEQMAVNNPETSIVEEQPAAPEPSAASNSSSSPSPSKIENPQSSIENPAVGGIALAEEPKIPETKEIVKEMTTPEPETQNPEPETQNPEPGTPELTQPVVTEYDVVSEMAVEMPAAEMKKMATGYEGERSVVFTVVDEMPSFPGGADSLYKYLRTNIHYPDSASAKGIRGTVYVQFVVETDGSVTNIILLRGIGGGCDEEALRVIEGMPRWIPGKQNGQAVRVYFILPVKFSINKKEN